MKAIMKGISILFTILILLSVAPFTAISAPGDVFTIDGMTFKVLTESVTTGTAQVGDGSNSAIDSNTAGSINIPATVLWNGKTYTVTNIGDWAFYSISLKSVTIPNSVTSIGENAFSSCSYLESVTIPNSVTNIGDSAFNNCISLESVTIPDSITTIGDHAFGNCRYLSEVWFDGNAPTVGSYTFSYVATNAIAYVNRTATGFPARGRCWNKLTVRHHDAMNNQSTTNTTVIQGSVTDNSSVAPLASISVPGDVFTVNGMTFSVLTESGTTGTVQVGAGSNSAIDRNTAGSINIPATVLRNGKTYTVTSIGYRAFVRCTSLTEVTIPNNVTSIGDEAFAYCMSLTSVTIPNSVISIGHVAFAYCMSLTSVTIPNSVTSIGNGAFVSSSLTSITIPNNMISIERGVFAYCTSLTSVTIPNSVTCIEGHAFKWCSSLTSVTIPNSVTCIGDAAFSDCEGLTSITIPDSVTYIGDRAFERCRILTSVTIPNSVTSIGKNPFAYCRSLMNVDVSPGNLVYISENGVLFNKSKTLLHSYPAGKAGAYIIPNSTTIISDSAFKGCSNLASVTIPDSVTSIGNYAFSECRNLTNVIIPNSVTRIGKGVFSKCNGLTSCTIPDSVTIIGDYAFSECRNLTNVIIPGSVTSIDNYAFYNCNKLTEVWFDGDAPTTNPSAFNYVAKGAIAYVYRNATGFPEEGQNWNGLTVRYRDDINTQPAADIAVTKGSIFGFNSFIENS